MRRSPHCHISFVNSGVMAIYHIYSVACFICTTISKLSIRRRYDDMDEAWKILAQEQGRTAISIMQTY
jgi:hypothetical protein